MAKFDIEDLLIPVGDDAPSGPDLEYDADFLALERAAAPKAEKVTGDSVIAGEEPDWDDVAERAAGLLERSKDLRVAIHLATAWLRIGGLAGWSAGLALIHGLLDTFWADVHPQLDAEDDDDPTLRVNSLAPLGSLNGPLRYLRATVFVQSPRVGKITLRDLKIANGSLKPAAVGDDDTPPPPTVSMSEIEGCCLDCAEELLHASAAAAQSALDNAKAIEKVLDGHLGSLGPNLKTLLSDHFELHKFLSAQVAKRAPATDDDEDEADSDAGDDDAGDDDSSTASGTGGGGRSVQAGGGRIAGPADVIKRIDEICEYYARYEPSSPVPMVLRRAQRLVGKDFLQLLQDLAPDGIDQLRVVTGAQPEAEADDDDD